MPIQRIVAATDFSLFAHRAALRAGRLARLHGARLRLLHALNAGSLRSFRKQQGADVDLAAVLSAEARRQLQSLAENVAAAGGPKADCDVSEGDVIDEVLQASRESDLVVLGPRGLNPVRDLILGAAAERIVRRVDRPLLVVKQETSSDYQCVLVPVDFSKHSLSALRFAHMLAPQATLHVFHAYEAPFDGRLLAASLSRDTMDGYRHSMEQEAHAAMRDFVAQASDVPNVQNSIERGDARATIVERAGALQASLIVMGKQGQSWLSELMLGSVARSTLEKAHCDVCVVPLG